MVKKSFILRVRAQQNLARALETTQKPTPNMPPPPPWTSNLKKAADGTGSS
jgi:hypothetical protein